MKIKKATSIVLLLALVIGINSAPANASTNSVQYEYISDIVNYLDASGKTLYLDAGTYGYFDADKCGVTATLQKQSGSSWTNYKVWTASSPSSHPDYVLFGTSLTVTSGKYRLVTSHSVTVGNYTEYDGLMSDEVTVS